MHEDLLYALYHRQKGHIKQQVKVELLSLKRKGFANLGGLPLKICVRIDFTELDDPILFEMLLHPIDSRSIALLSAAISKDNNLQVDQIHLEFQYKNVPIDNYADYFEEFSPHNARPTICTIKGKIMAVSNFVYSITNTVFKCINAYCLNRDTIMCKLSGHFARLDGDIRGVLSNNNVPVCSTCRLAMTEMSHARLFTKTCYVSLSIESKYPPINVELNNFSEDFRLGKEIIVHGFPKLDPSKRNLIYSIVACCVSEQPPRITSMVPIIYCRAARLIRLAIASFGFKVPLSIKLTCDDYYSLRHLIFSVCKQYNCLCLPDLKIARHYSVKMPGIEFGKLNMTACRFPFSRFVFVTCINSNPTILIDDCRNMNIPLIFINSSIDNEDVDIAYNVTDDELVEYTLEREGDKFSGDSYEPSSDPKSFSNCMSIAKALAVEQGQSQTTWSLIEHAERLRSNRTILFPPSPATSMK